MLQVFSVIPMCFRSWGSWTNFEGADAVMLIEAVTFCTSFASEYALGTVEGVAEAHKVDSWIQRIRWDVEKGFIGSDFVDERAYGF